MVRNVFGLLLFFGGERARPGKLRVFFMVRRTLAVNILRLSVDRVFQETLILPGESIPLGLEDNMTTAESFVKEYLERGYGLESIRLLAESREQPLGAEILAVIEAMAASGNTPASTEDSGPCETAAYPVARGEEDAVFFIAADDEAVSEDGAVDFDVMAGTASGEESVAEILVGRPAEAIGEDIRLKSPSEAGADDPVDGELGIWSRLWSKVSGAPGVPALAPSVLGRKGDGLTFEDDAISGNEEKNGGEEGDIATAAEASASEAMCETVAAHVESVSDAFVHEVAKVVDRSEAANPVVEEAAPEAASVNDALENSVEPVLTSTGEHSAGIAAAEVAPDTEPQAFANDIAAQAEISADYIPGSISELYDGPENSETAPSGHAPAADVSDSGDAVSGDAVSESVIEAEKRRLDEAQAAIAASAQVVEAGTPSTAETAEDTSTAPIAAEPERTVESRQESRRDRRRRERAEKKKQKRAKKAPAAALPEIVLTRSEGTETLSVVDETAAPESPVSDGCDPVAGESATPTPEPETSLPMPATANLAGENAEQGKESGKDEAPHVNESMGILTPNDLIEDDSQIEDSSVLSAVSASEEEEAASLDMNVVAAAEDEHVAAPLLPTDGGEREAAETAGENGETEIADSSDNPALFFSGNDHLMIIAGGGVTEDEWTDLADGEVSAPESASEEDIADNADTEPVGNNVILFSEKFPVFAGVRASDPEYLDDEFAEQDAETYHPVLRMLPPIEPDAVEEAGGVVERDLEAQAGSPAAALAVTAPAALLESGAAIEPGELEYSGPAENRLGEEAKLALVRAMLGVGSVEDFLPEPGADADGGHVIVAQEPEPEPDNSLEREVAVREEMEREYQVRLDEFAARLLDVQGIAAASEAKVRDKKAELDAKGAIIDEMKKRLDEEVEAGRKMAGSLIAAKAETKAREDELERFNGMREEHERLYKEFEDLRRAYNEVVADVMPGLQSERDDLALTVERQSANEDKLRSSLGSARKRLAVGYSLAGAACLALVALPVSNWLKSGQDDRQLAMEHQKITELQDTLQREVQQNIHSKNTIVELENKVEVARAQIADLQGKNQELARVSGRPSQQSSGLAVFRPSESGSSGTPTRASDMALQATTQSGGRLHVNEIRDPAGSIEQLAALNRQQYSPPNTQMAQAPQSGTRPIAMSAVARVEPRQANGLRPSSSTRPSPVAPALRQSETAGTQRQRGGAPVAREGEVLAKVKKGEGVAQVVYRELGTWDPEVISWVIRENGITNDKRGNPRIHPDQVLRLPKGGRVNQAASAAPRR